MVQEPTVDAFGNQIYGKLLDPAYYTAFFPYVNAPQDTALRLALAQYQGQIAAQGNAAQLQGDAMRAQATVAAANAAAQGGIQQQRISTTGQLQGLQASIESDLEKARNGDIGAAQRLQANLGLQAGIANQATALRLSELGGSGQLRDYMARQAFLYGGGGQPGWNSSTAGLENRLWATAPTVAMPPMYTVPKVNMALPAGGGGGGGVSFSVPGGGGGGGMAAPDFNAILASTNKAMGAGVPLFNYTPTPAPTPVPASAPAPAPAPIPAVQTPITWDQVQANAAAAGVGPNAWLRANPSFNLVGATNTVTGVTAMAHGGTLAPGQGALVGEKGPEVLKANPDGSIEIIPLRGGYQGGGTFLPGWQTLVSRALSTNQGFPMTSGQQLLAGRVAAASGNPNSWYWGNNPAAPFTGVTPTVANTAVRDAPYGTNAYGMPLTPPPGTPTPTWQHPMDAWRASMGLPSFSSMMMGLYGGEGRYQNPLFPLDAAGHPHFVVPQSVKDMQARFGRPGAPAPAWPHPVPAISSPRPTVGGNPEAGPAGVAAPFSPSPTGMRAPGGVVVGRTTGETAGATDGVLQSVPWTGHEFDPPPPYDPTNPGHALPIGQRPGRVIPIGHGPLPPPGVGAAPIAVPTATPMPGQGVSGVPVSTTTAGTGTPGLGGVGGGYGYTSSNAPATTAGVPADLLNRPMRAPIPYGQPGGATVPAGGWESLGYRNFGGSWYDPQSWKNLMWQIGAGQRGPNGEFLGGVPYAPAGYVPPETVPTGFTPGTTFSAAGGGVPVGAAGGTTPGAPVPPNAAATNPDTYPWLNALKTGRPITGFGPPTATIDIPGAAGFGQTVPTPGYASSGFRGMDPYAREQMLQLWESLGIPRDLALYWVNSATPGWHGYNPPPALGF